MLISREFCKIEENKMGETQKSVGDVGSEQMPDVKRLLETESSLGLTINKCHIFAEKRCPSIRSVWYRLSEALERGLDSV